MLTKDKKPFTYTPGMGGKLDLSQIRSPRMARRVAKNANDEGIEGPPKVAVESKPPGTTTATNLMVQPQVAIPVLPVNVPAAPHLNRAPSSVNRTLSNTLDKQVETPKITPKVDTKAVPITISSSQSSTPESPNTPTQVTLAKAPTPWLQNKNKPQENLPEWAKRPTVNKAANDPSENAHSPTTIYVQVQSPVPQSSQTKLKQEQEWYPTPQDQCQQPLKVQQLPQQRQEPQQKQNMTTSHQTNPPRYERVVPIRIEDRPSVFDANRESGHHQFKQPPTVHHQQRWGQIPVQQHTLKNQVQNRSQDQEQSSIHVATVSKPVQSQPSGTYIIPMVVEGDRKTTPSNTGNNTIEKGIRVVQQQGSAPNTPLIQQNEPGPVQSRSFRVLQKITDTDGSNDVGTEQMRKLDLSEDDRLLMNKFKEQVDHETYLHQEEDPRYRGAAIPSRAFRFLQNMTESNDSSVTCTAPRSSQNIANKRQNRNSKSFEETQTNLPPSEQQVQEPKKYMGSAIPSRSFKILQAMTTPESIATQENRQADYNCQTENNLPGNQQDVFLLSRPVPFWYPESWWYCYSVQQYSDPSAKSANNTNKHSLLPRPYTGYSDGGACVGYESFSPLLCGNARYSQADYDGIQQSRVDGNDCDNIYYPVTDSSFAQNDRHFVRNDVADEFKNTYPLEQIDHLDDQSGGTSRSADENCNNDKITRLVTSTSTVDEEGVVVPDSANNDAISNNGKMSERTFDLCINVPNYTYMESSDSNDTSDSSDSSQSSGNKLADSCQKVRNCSDTIFSNTSSDGDSDSYVAYSTGLNLYEKSDIDASRATSSDVQNAVAYSEESSTDNCKSDFDSCSDNFELNRRDQECEPTIASTVRRHQMNVIDEDTERSDSKGSHYENERNIDERKDALFETTDDPSDDVETMVSVSLPLRFNFSVSENNEDITTVTIGDSKIKAEKSRNSKRRYSDKSSDDNVDNTRVDVTNDTSVNFTVKRYVADATNTASGRETAIPCVNFTLRRDSKTKINEGNKERQKNIKTKFASNETVENEMKDFAESASKEVENRAVLEPEIVVREDILPRDDNNHRVQHTGSNFENRTIRESKANTCGEWIQDNFEAPVQVRVIDANETRGINARDKNDDSAINSNDRCVDLEIDQTHTKHLLSVRDSHEDTDDEDSGVTSDISRMISEVDTDSECTSSKTSKKYQRTQTHSRLFRLLNDDTVLSDCSKTDGSSFRQEYPNSPLDVYNCDDDCYCFNYSSDPISSEYSSSVRDERSSRRSYNATVRRSSCTGSPNIVKLNHPSSQLKHAPSKDDPHLRAWKSSKLPDLDNVLPSLAYKILDSKMPSWAYKVNVLCPRIKSTKDVPQTLSARSTGNIDNRPSSVILTVPTSCAHSKTK
ncbi:uncharacterized protein LOC109855756 isoform X2 [Pseudomyrmex gracilis]|nr:uncharacterized protein LOC109855756 isoform X2 [Pseudomyrmex gracilis]